MIKFLADEAANPSGGMPGWVMWVILGVLLVGMMVMSIIPRKKQQKKAQEMMQSIRVGTKIKTIGGFVGVIKEINNVDNTFVLDISFEQNESNLVVIDRSAVYTVMVEGAAQGTVVEKEKAEEVVALDDMQADSQAKEKKTKKSKKKNSTEDVFSESETLDAQILNEEFNDSENK